MTTNSLRLPGLAASAAAFALAACSDTPAPITSTESSLSRATHSAPAPAPLVSVVAGGETRSIWPYTGTSFSGAPQDPLNLIFVGAADPRSIRAALFALDGDRTAFGFPPVFPFNCTWKDAIGHDQTAYADMDAWTGSVIQLECGEYDPVRFHLRLFPAGDWTLANAHVDVLIPGTVDHQVLSWEVGEQFVMVDFVRSGLLTAAPTVTDPINPAPFGEIPPIIYNGLPAALRQLAGGPPGNVTTPVPILSDGRATILQLNDAGTGEPGTRQQRLTIQFNQVIPKPFCAQPNEFVLVQGPVELSQDVRVAASGNLTRQFFARAELNVTPFNPLTGLPLGPTQRAQVREHGDVTFTDQVRRVANHRTQQLETGDGGPQRLTVDLQIGPHSLTRFSREESCGR
jgi:hypothetical protein